MRSDPFPHSGTDFVFFLKKKNFFFSRFFLIIISRYPILKYFYGILYELLRGLKSFVTILRRFISTLYDSPCRCKLTKRRDLDFRGILLGTFQREGVVGTVVRIFCLKVETNTDLNRL